MPAIISAIAGMARSCGRKDDQAPFGGLRFANPPYCYVILTKYKPYISPAE